MCSHKFQILLLSTATSCITCRKHLLGADLCLLLGGSYKPKSGGEPSMLGVGKERTFLG